MYTFGTTQGNKYLQLTLNTAGSAFESIVTEAKFDKKKLMKAMKQDDGMIQLGNGQEYVIYAYDNGNDDNDAMWGDKTIFALDQDGGEHEIEYSDIVRYDESTINERDIVRLGKLDDASMVHKILKDEMIKNKISRTRSGDGEVTVYTNDIPNLKKLMDDLSISYELHESTVNEAKYNKKSLLKKLGKADDATIQTGNGKEYVIYNPDSNNDDNAAMWNDNSVFAVDQDGEEHEIDYKDIGLVLVESNVNEAEVSSAEDFREYATAVLQNAFEEDYDETKAEEVISGLISKHGEDYGAMIGALQSSLA